MKKTILFLLIVITLKLHAQPGGGGGLVILRIFDENLKEIVLNKSSIKIELMELDSVMTILNKFEIDSRKEIYLPPSNNYSPNTQGLLIKFKNKNYRIDFENIISENASGYIEIIDSLVLFKPYILSKRSCYHPSLNGNYWLLYDLASFYLPRGVTPSTFEKLSEYDLMFDSMHFAYNRSPKPWMEDFTNLYKKYSETTYGREPKEIHLFLNELEEIIKKYGTNDAFVLLKMELLYKIQSYNKIIKLYEKHPFEYHFNLTHIHNMLIDCYTKRKDYIKAINICKTSAAKQLNGNKSNYYKYIYHKFFIEIYYQNKNREKEIQTILDNEEYKQYYSYTFEQLEILQSYCIYKFTNKIKGIERLNVYDKKCIPNPILKDVYPSVNITDPYLDYCSSLIFGIMMDIL